MMVKKEPEQEPEIKIVKKSEFDRKNAKSNQEDVWNFIANPWKEYRVKPLIIVKEFLKKVSSDSKNVNLKIVDLGCGSGRNMMAFDNVEYVGIDFSKEQVKHAQKNAKNEEINAELYVSKIDQLPFIKNEIFDYGLFMAALHCLETKKERKNSLKEFYRILKPGAEALISVWDAIDKRFDSVGNHGEVYMSWKRDNKSYMRFYYLYKKQELLDLLESVGFEVVKVYRSRKKDRFSRKNLVVKIKK